MNSNGPYIAKLDDFPIEKSMFDSWSSEDLISRYQGNKKLLGKLVENLSLNKELQKEYWQNGWIQTYTIENRIILNVLGSRLENIQLESLLEKNVAGRKEVRNGHL
ncbi:hypothetical protein [Cecembia rubra]|uniref:Uncharacterized protein n=1 Tax=Cecembia rubra TaxID=1485585 RepID=A0A2P8E322_9BACT|nr:hypothetical protein [Cecembia rubra]PSL03878.1 hypothetical protein CLV48_106118 [Cecembia rubra]